MSQPVLDASALLALLLGEAGSGSVRESLPNSVMSSVNWCEVIERGESRGVRTTALRRRFAALGLTVLPFGAEDAEAAARLRPATKAAGLGLADRACLALAQRLRAPALTADRVWAGLSIDVDVQVIR